MDRYCSVTVCELAKFAAEALSTSVAVLPNMPGAHTTLRNAVELLMVKATWAN